MKVLNRSSPEFVPAFTKLLDQIVKSKNNTIDYKGTQFIENRKVYKFNHIITSLPNFSYCFWIDEETGLLLKTQTYKDDELVMELERRNIKINTDIQDSEFEFVIFQKE